MCNSDSVSSFLKWMFMYALYIHCGLVKPLSGVLYLSKMIIDGFGWYLFKTGIVLQLANTIHAKTCSCGQISQTGDSYIR